MQGNMIRPRGRDTPNEDIGGGLASLARLPDINSAQMLESIDGGSIFCRWDRARGLNRI